MRLKAANFIKKKLMQLLLDQKISDLVNRSALGFGLVASFPFPRFTAKVDRRDTGEMRVRGQANIV